MNYKTRLEYSEKIRKIFTDITNLHINIHEVIELNDENKYKEIADIVYAKLSLIEIELLSLRDQL